VGGSSVISAPGRLTLEEFKLKASWGYRANLGHEILSRKTTSWSSVQARLASKTLGSITSIDKTQNSNFIVFPIRKTSGCVQPRFKTLT
jgi:hypothetical protein